MAKGKSLCIEWWEKQMYTFTKNIFIRDEAQHMRGGGGAQVLEHQVLQVFGLFF